MLSEGKHKFTLEYPKHYFKPEDLLTFIEMKGFTDDCKRLQLSDVDLAAIQIGIMARPKGSPVVRGTGGLRKLRSYKGKRGKRKAFRVGYVYFEEFGIVLLVIVYPKNERDEIPESMKADIADLVRRQYQAFAQGIRR